jgi:hypothetical protein
VIVVLVLVVVAAVTIGVAIAGGAAGLLGDRSGGGRVGVVAVPATIGMVVLVVLVLVLVVGAVGMGRTASGPPDAEETTGADVTTGAEVADDVEPQGIDGPAAAFDATIRIAPVDALRLPVVVGDLAAGDVVEVHGDGFPADAEGVVAQCENSRDHRCDNIASVRSDNAGRVRTAYRLGPESSGGALVVEIDFARAAATLVFGAAEIDPPPLLQISGRSLVVSRGAPRASLVVAHCAVDAAVVGDCDTGASLVLDAAGSGRVDVDRPDRGARLILLDAQGAVAAGPVLVAERPSPPVHIDSGRLVVGLGLALLLVLAAALLVRTTDWRVPAEAATPALDAIGFDA